MVQVETHLLENIFNKLLISLSNDSLAVRNGFPAKPKPAPIDFNPPERHKDSF